MPASLVVWILTALIIVAVLTQRWWEPKLAARGVNVHAYPWRWWLTGYPRVALRMWWTWRRVCHLNGLSVSFSPTQRVVGRNLVVQGTALRPKTPVMGVPVPTRTGLRVRVRLHPGQTPAPYLAAAHAMEHAWEVHTVRVSSPVRGEVLISVIPMDPLGRDGLPPAEGPGTLAVLVGRVEDDAPWVLDLRHTPHWLVTGATQSGKSTLLSALVHGLARRRVALVGIDCKGGVELGLYAPRLSALATDRAEAIRVLGSLVELVRDRMRLCRAASVRTVWDLRVEDQPVPVVVLVDELAELYLTDGTKQDREDAELCGTLLLRLAQLGAALGVHLVLAGQRVGSDLGPKVTALRSQLGGRVAHRSHDSASAEMTLGDVSPDAVVVAQSISEHEKGVAVVTTTGGQWMRARSNPIPAKDAAQEAERNSSLTPPLPGIERKTYVMTGGENE
ncbi:FtsK/SpoIIIE domain-containing protein [Streptomyces sp. NPDC048172]|uniref:FtsK/SpoIIIE domain-containing protein n=1 Tax=Streptomyces sp. NPDC048172 TaxID=3365505 RepID=UPI0037209FBE